MLGADGAAHADQDAGLLYGANLMTQEEWREHHEAMQQLSAEQRLAYRRRMHVEMPERAHERGTKLPDAVPEWTGSGSRDAWMAQCGRSLRARHQAGVAGDIDGVGGVGRNQTQFHVLLLSYSNLRRS